MVGESSGYRIRDLEESERPRERLEMQGAGALRDAELLAILLRVGKQGVNAVQIGQRMLFQFGGLSGLHRASFAELCQVEGVGPAKAAQIKAAIELGRRLSTLTPEERPTIASPEDAADRVQYAMMALEQEELWVLLLDSRNRLITTEHLYRGSLNASTVRPAEVFKTGIRHNAGGLIVVHNHPSGDPAPSPEDINLTRRLIEAGEMLELPILDHIVIGLNRYESIKSRYPDLW
ncbi:MAG: DNA repair protein RadC [Anaerolineaceae bacterium]|jgi:DNA repair protein RadC|nr:DNA repair protein RadC [Anaerolineaceae bacterium]